jgi:signal transduction histidine kinase
VVYGLEAVQVIHSSLPIEIYAFWIPIPIYFIALFAFRIFDPIPLARQVVIDQLRDGMLVLDAQGRVASLNPAASQILAAPLKQVQGKPIEEILPEDPKLNSLHVEGWDASKPIEITMGSGAEARCYELKFSPLDDFRGVPVGRLLLLHDVTEQRRSQAQILEQQRALSMLQEREQLARELHDGLGQVLAAAHLQASAARMLLERGEISQMGECLDDLAGTTLQAEAELREYLLGAQFVDAVKQSFLATLQEYLRRFNHQFNLPVELSVPAELEGRELPQTVAIQLLRIIQEGLSNTRKHAHARYAQVSLTLSGESLQVIITDDGLGFDPSSIVTQPGAGFGLRSMRERAEALGGTLQINSGPEKGTRIMVEVPISSPSAVNRKPT